MESTVAGGIDTQSIDVVWKVIIKNAKRNPLHMCVRDFFGGKCLLSKFLQIVEIITAMCYYIKWFAVNSIKGHYCCLMTMQIVIRWSTKYVQVVISVLKGYV